MKRFCWSTKKTFVVDFGLILDDLNSTLNHKSNLPEHIDFFVSLHMIQTVLSKVNGFILFAGGIHLLGSGLVRKIGWQLCGLIIFSIYSFIEVSQLP